MENCAYPKISIVTVSFNQGRFIEDNILSVLSQKYPNVEHIVIDAGSTDETLDILKKYDAHIDWISEPDDGQSDGLNKGFRKSSGDIIGWFNSDDRVPEGALHRVSEFFLNNPQEIAVVGDQAIIDEFGERLSSIYSCEYSFDYLVNKAKGVTQNSLFFKREVFEKLGYLDETLHYVMDHDFFLRLASIKKIPYLNATLGEFRIQKDAKTAKGTFYFSKELIKIRRKYGGKCFSPANKDSLYIIFTEPLRRVTWFRKFIQRVRSNNG